MVCEKHGQFQQSPDSHLRGAGCLKCANETRGGKYRDDYARAVAERVKVLAEGLVELDIDSYKGQNIEANFTCKLHGDFTRRAIAALMTSHPCPECARAALGNYPSDGENLETVMLLALGAGYTVEPFQYDGRTTEVTLWCGHSMHPPFQKIVYNIKKLRGCSICSKQLAAQKRKETMEWLINSSRTDRFQEWLVAAIEIHGAKFDYSQVDYQTARVKVKIICPSHGSFWQAPGIHLNGGCRKCADADLKGRYSEVFFQKYPEAGYQPAILYYLRFQFGEVDFYKVGITINDVAQRHSMLNTLSGLKFEALAEAPMTLREAYDAEQSIQGEHGDCSRFEIPFPKDVQRGIRIGPSECFQQPLTKEILSKYFK
jgi:hypothetical protein